MFWMLVVLAIVLIYLWIRNNAKPNNFAKNIAKSQLSGYDRFSDDGLSKEILYFKAISTRPGVHKYYSISEMKHDAKSCSFRAMVEILVNREFQFRSGRIPTMDELNVMSKEVYKIIPDGY